jgi:ClpP class serine protease
MARSSSGSRRKGDLARLAQRVLGQPLAIDPRKADVILGVLAPRLGLDMPAIQAGDLDEGAGGDRQVERRGTVAIIPVHGTLVQRAAWLDAFSGLTSYQALREDIAAALADPAVSAVVLDVDSGGGEVAGFLDFADWLYGQRGTKRIVAISNEGCFSAAYGIASAADAVWLTRTAGVGSIGVIAKHADRTGEKALQGLKVTTVYAGERKADLDPDSPISDEAREMLQAEVNRVYGLFAETVARQRGVDVGAILALKSGVRFGGDAITAGLADHVGTLDELVADLAAGSPINTKIMEARMADKTKSGEDETPKDDKPKGKKAEEQKPEEQAESGEGDEKEPEAKKGRKAKKAEDGDGDPSEGDARKAHADIVDLCCEAGVPKAAAAFIKEGLSADAVKKRLADAAGIRTAVTAAHRANSAIPMSLADTFIQAGTPLSAVHEAMGKKLADLAGPEISSHRKEERPQAGNHGWDKAVAPYAQPKK